MESNSSEPTVALPEPSLGIGPLQSSKNSPNTTSPNNDSVSNSHESRQEDQPEREDDLSFCNRCGDLLSSIEDLVHESDQMDLIVTNSDANALTEHNLEEVLPKI